MSVLDEKVDNIREIKVVEVLDWFSIHQQDVSLLQSRYCCIEDRAWRVSVIDEKVDNIRGIQVVKVLHWFSMHQQDVSLLQPQYCWNEDKVW